MRLGLPLTSLLCLPLLACGSGDDAAQGEDTGVHDSGDSKSLTGTAEGGEGNSGDGDPSGDPGDGDGDPGDGDPGGDSGGEEAGDGDGDGDIEPGQLTAGEWRDLDHWDFWLGLGADGSTWLSFFDLWGFDTRARVPVLAVSEGEPVVDAPIVLRDANDQIVWRARTDNLGRAELWPNLLDGGELGFPLTVESGQQSVELQALPGALDPVLLELPPAQPPVDLDLMFVIDTTGSMGDELSYIKAELGDVITRVQSELGNDFGLRLSVNFYRDTEDEYLVRSFPFTADIPAALGQLAAQSADGGGDYPEAVEAALQDAIFDHAWSPNARARLMFVVLDAPPHDTPDNRASLTESVIEAADQGIRVIPLGASGIDKSTEFLMRELDIITGGTYTFLTNHSGIGGDHIEPTIGDYDVELLNDLMVRLIVESML